MVNQLKTYAEWSNLLDHFLKENDEERIMQDLEAAEIEWTGVVAEKLTRRALEVLEAKFTRTVELLQLELQRARGSEPAIVVALLNTRRRFNYFNRLCHLKAFPATVRESMQQASNKFIEDTQRSLENTAKADRSGVMGNLLKYNSLRNYQSCTPAISQTITGEGDIGGSVDFKRRRRRVLL
ncbi:hypothetical protein [Paenibacillus lautus]|uniref:hypothetical protein n=1 Tax=Paenibacillus lautus TaxID=1401 RepID=UPI003D2AFEE5